MICPEDPYTDRDLGWESPEDYWEDDDRDVEEIEVSVEEYERRRVA